MTTVRRILAGSAIALGIGLAGLAQAQDPAPQLEYVFSIKAELEESVEVGETVRGSRRFIPITGGEVTGEVTGTVRGGAWDWQIDRPDGCTDLEADYFIELEGGAVVNVVNRATICRAAVGEAPKPIYTRPVFEPPMGEYAWLGQGTFIGRLEPDMDGPVRAVRIHVYQVR